MTPNDDLLRSDFCRNSRSANGTRPSAAELLGSGVLTAPVADQASGLLSQWASWLAGDEEETRPPRADQASGLPPAPRRCEGLAAPAGSRMRRQRADACAASRW